MIRACGLWIKKGRESGEEFLVGNSGALAFFVRKNTFKKDNPNEPDFILSIAASRPPEREDLKKSTFENPLSGESNGDEEVPVGNAKVENDSPDDPF